MKFTFIISCFLFSLNAFALTPIFEVKRFVSGGDAHSSDLQIECQIFKNSFTYSFKRFNGSTILEQTDISQTFKIDSTILSTLQSLDPLKSNYDYTFTKNYDTKSSVNAFSTNGVITLENELLGDRLRLNHPMTIVLLDYVWSVCR